MALLKLSNDEQQDFFRRDQEYVKAYLADKDAYDKSLSRINVFRFDEWSETKLVDPNKSFFLQKVLYPKTSDQRSFYIVEQEAKRYGLELQDIYNINEDGFRSDLFSDSKEGLKILFAGCSITFGHGLPEEYIWPKIVYNSLANRGVGLSNYHNISKLGVSRLEIMLMISDWIEYFGIPDIILINMPESSRDDAGKNFHTTKQHHSTRALYTLISKIVQDNGGMVLSTSWSDEDLLDNTENPSSISRYDSHLTYWYEDLLSYVHDFANKNKKHKFAEYMLRSMDLAHPGIAEHAFYADLFLQRLDNVV